MVSLKNNTLNILFKLFGTKILTKNFIHTIIILGGSMEQNFVVTSIKHVVFVGKDEYGSMRSIFKSNLPYHELILHLSGKSLTIFNGETFECEENTIRFLPKGENNEYIVDRKERGECIDVSFETDGIVSPKAFVLKLKNNARIRLLFKKIFSVWVSKNDGYYFECMSLLYKIFAEMQKEDYVTDKQYNAIKPAIHYIEENFFNEKISVKSLAHMCKISESYLKKLFIKKFSMSPVKYIIQLKINHACDLLSTERCSVKQVAEICGYSDIYFFSRQFKEYTGITPTEFKNKYKSSK